jgi:hypothetical protein
LCGWEVCKEVLLGRQRVAVQLVKWQGRCGVHVAGEEEQPWKMALDVRYEQAFEQAAGARLASCARLQCVQVEESGRSSHGRWQCDVGN